jgi:hypothetical protein
MEDRRQGAGRENRKRDRGCEIGVRASMTRNNILVDFLTSLTLPLATSLSSSSSS